MSQGKNKPKSGSMSVYPRVRAKKRIPKFNSYGNLKDLKIEGCKPLFFYAFKAGTTHVVAKNAKKKSAGYSRKINLPVTVLETPDLKVIGARFYKKNKIMTGHLAVNEFINQDKEINKRVKGKKQKNITKLEDILKKTKDADFLVLLAKVDPSKTKIGSKKGSIVEIPLSGTYEEQIQFLKDNFNKTLNFKDSFEKDVYLDIKAITKGHGFTGPVKRHGIKVQRPKHKTKRHVGSISPWHPATVMFTVPRPGQYGYHNRTVFGKKLLLVDSEPSKVNPKGGFKRYGEVNTNFALVAGTIPGPTKRIVAIRRAIRKQERLLEISEIEYISK